jgi:predicted nucleotidyltransferase
MTRDEIITRIRARADEIRELGADALFLFGSAARDELRDDSDVDVFIDRRAGFDFRFTHLTDLHSLLEQEVGRSVDLATRNGLHPRLRERIERSAIRVF